MAVTGENMGLAALISVLTGQMGNDLGATVDGGGENMGEKGYFHEGFLVFKGRGQFVFLRR